MKLFIALAALFTFLAVCSWYAVSEGFLGAGDIFQTGFTQAQDGEQHQDLANPDMLNLPVNERTFTNFSGQSVLDSQNWYSTGFLQRHEGNIWHQAYPYRPGLLRESKEGRQAFIAINWHRSANRLTL